MNPTPIISIRDLNKTYAGGFTALKSVSLDIRAGEIFALLGPNGAGKTTLISIVCGLVNATGGKVAVAGHDIWRDYRGARSEIGLVPQEMSTDMFETVWATVSFTRGLFGKRRDDALLERLLRELALWDKRHSKIMELSGGMKRRVMIAKALAHEPSVLFLDEPTAGVDVELRRDMWQMVRRLRESGVTIILTTHYIQEAEEMADRVGVITRGQLLLVEEKQSLMQKLGKKTLHLQLVNPLPELPAGLTRSGLELAASGSELVYRFDSREEDNGMAALLKQLAEIGIEFRDLRTRESSLEEIFVDLVHAEEARA